MSTKLENCPQCGKTRFVNTQYRGGLCKSCLYPTKRVVRYTGEYKPLMGKVKCEYGDNCFACPLDDCRKSG